MKIDAYAHILPRAYFDRLVEVAPDKRAIKRWLTIPVLHDLDARLAMMEEFGADYRQILTLSMPALESVAGPDQTPALSRLANDSMANLVARRPERFPGWCSGRTARSTPKAARSSSARSSPRSTRSRSPRPTGGRSTRTTSVASQGTACGCCNNRPRRMPTSSRCFAGWRPRGSPSCSKAAASS